MNLIKNIVILFVLIVIVLIPIGWLVDNADIFGDYDNDSASNFSYQVDYVRV